MVQTKRRAVTAEIKIRLPKALRDQIEAAAIEGGVSMNTEMIRRLHLTFDYTSYTANEQFEHVALLRAIAKITRRFLPPEPG